MGYITRLWVILPDYALYYQIMGYITRLRVIIPDYGLYYQITGYITRLRVKLLDYGLYYQIKHAPIAAEANKQVSQLSLVKPTKFVL